MPEILRSFRSFRMHWKKRMTVRFFAEEDFYVEEDMLTGKEDQKEKDV